MNGDARRSLIVGAAVFILSMGWMFFLDQLGITPDLLLASIGSVHVIGLLITGSFAGFVVFFTAMLGVMTAYADKDERSRVYLTLILPAFPAAAISALLFANFAQWYPLALFYFGSIPLMIETTRIKRLELKNFPVARSSFSGVQRGMQVMGIGVLVTLAVVALPQSTSLYSGFEQSLFGGKVIEQLDVQKITTDFLISTQRNTLTQIIDSESFQKLRESNVPDVVSFVALMDQTLLNVNSAEYREKIKQQVENQQKGLDTQSLLNQIQSNVPGYGLVKNNYWAISAFLGSLVFFMVSMFVLQPLAAIFGTVLYTIIPTETYSTREEETSAPEPAPVAPGAPATQGWDSPSIAAQPEAPAPTVPTYTHTEDAPPNTPSA